MPEYRLAAGVSWTVEPGGIFLTHNSGAAVLRLAYPEAAMWDWMSRGEPWEGLIRKTRAAAKLEEADAERVVREALRAWVEAGWLVSEASGG